MARSRNRAKTLRTELPTKSELRSDAARGASRSSKTTQASIVTDTTVIAAKSQRMFPWRRNGKKQTGPAAAPADHAKFSHSSFAARSLLHRSENNRLVDVIAIPRPRP